MMYPHGGCGNHGCEAIVRSTLKLSGAEGLLLSSHPDQDALYGLDQCCEIRSDRKVLKRLSFRYAKSAVKYYLFEDRMAFDRSVFRPVINAAEECDFALSIGGDNYCYGDPQFLYLINRELKRRNVKTVLWGCSIDPNSLQGAMLEDLKGYDRIVARESLSFDALRAKGLDSVSLFPDPAFVLDRKKTMLPDGFVDGNTVGINVSPMILSYGKSEDLVLSNYIRLIETILHNTDMAVALIPHVVWIRNDDRQPLKPLFDRFKDTGRVSFVEDRPAEELKEILARCRFVVAARTHATIAAWSECIPTLAIGYSTKAQGIARDLFGEADAPVISVQSLHDEKTLSDIFLRLVASESEIRHHLRSIMPEYRAKAAEAKIVLTELIR